jgi:hypothetical protein
LNNQNLKTNTNKVIEIDITSRTQLDRYRVLGVGELWRFDGSELKIYLLQGGQYVLSPESPHFPQFPLIEIIPQYLEQTKTEGRNQTMKAFRNWVKQNIRDGSRR